MTIDKEAISRKATKLAHEYAKDSVNVPCTALEYNLLFWREYTKQYNAMTNKPA